MTGGRRGSTSFYTHETGKKRYSSPLQRKFSRIYNDSIEPSRRFREAHVYPADLAGPFDLILGDSIAEEKRTGRKRTREPAHTDSGVLEVGLCVGDGKYWIRLMKRFMSDNGLKTVRFITRRNPETWTRRYGARTESRKFSPPRTA
jgi:hypothetical protein